MFVGFWNTARNNKENILYAVVTIFLLERVRTGWNRIRSRGQKEGSEPGEVHRRQHSFVVKAAFLYALPLLLPVVKYIYRSIDELSWSVQGLVVLKSTSAFFVILILTECFLALVIYNLLRIYIEKMNAAVGFFTKIGRNIWDGSKAAFQASGSVGSHVAGGVRTLTSGAWVKASGGVRTLTSDARTRASGAWSKASGAWDEASGAWSKAKATSKRSAERFLTVPRAIRKLRPGIPLRFTRRAQDIEGGRCGDRETRQVLPVARSETVSP